jgi:hypothetical protein
MRHLGIPGIFVLAFLLASCFKNEEAIAPHARGGVRADTIPMTVNYTYQVYFDLGTGMIVSKNEKTTGDLGFECTPAGWHIILNTANFMKVADIGEVPFGQPQDTSGVSWKFDKSDGNPDSNAVGVWLKIVGEDTLSNNHVYVVNRGIDDNANNVGFCQVIFDSLSSGKYYFRFADISGGVIHAGVAAKDCTVNYVYYSLSGDGSEKDLEPSKEMYDLLFTQYTTLLFTDEGEPYPYLVTGVLLNRSGTEAAKDTVHSFGSLSLNDAMQLHYSSDLDVIGYDWKYYSFITGAYSVRTGLSYVIRDRAGYYYKLRFTGFYNSQGVKGYPVFEFQRL